MYEEAAAQLIKMTSEVTCCSSLLLLQLSAVHQVFVTYFLMHYLHALLSSAVLFRLLNIYIQKFSNKLHNNLFVMRSEERTINDHLIEELEVILFLVCV